MRREAEVKIDFKTWGSVFTAGLTGVTGTECKTFVKDFQNQKLPIGWFYLSTCFSSGANSVEIICEMTTQSRLMHAFFNRPGPPYLEHGDFNPNPNKSSRLKEIPPPLLIETVSALPTILRLVPVLATAASPAPLDSILFLHIGFIFIKDYLARFLLFKSGSGVSEVGWSRT